MTEELLMAFNRSRGAGVLRQLARAWFAGLCVTALAACGGGLVPDDGASGSGVAVGPVARLEVQPSSLMLTAAGATRQLTVRAFDDQGREVPNPPLVFSSSLPSEISVDAKGLVRAESALGSTLLRISSGSVRAPVVTAIAAKPAEGVLLVADEQVVSQPVASPGNTAKFTGGRYRVTLSGVGLPTPGTLVMGTGGVAVGGRVLSATQTGSATQLEMEVVPLPALLRSARIRLDFAADDLVAEPVAASRAKTLDPQQKTTFTRGRFECESDIDPAVISVEIEPKLTNQLSPKFDLDIDSGTVNLFSMRLEGQVDAAFKATLAFGIAVKGGLTCNFKGPRWPIPITGPISLIAAPGLRLGAQFKLDAALQVNLEDFGVEAKIPMELRMGIEYEKVAGFRDINRLTRRDIETNVRVKVPDVAARVQASAFLGATAALDFGGLLASGDLMVGTLGPQFEGKFGSLYDVSTDSIYNSEYELKALMSIAPGSDIVEMLKWLLGLDSLSNFEVSIFKEEWPIGRSAQVDSAKVNKAKFFAGDELTFDVTLKPENIDFPTVGYNINEVRIYRLKHADVKPSSSATLVATASASPGQKDFRLVWKADSDGEATDLQGRPTFYAFLVPKFLSSITSVLPLELGAVIGPSTDVPVAVCGGWVHSLALDKDGVVWGWGAASSLGGSGGLVTPFKIMGKGTAIPERVVKIACGHYHSMALSDTGLLYQWSNLDAGPYAGSQTSPALVSGIAGVVDMAAGAEGSIAAVKDGTVWVWGQRIFGLTGGSVAIPMQVPGLGNVMKVGAGAYTAMAATADGKVYGWGENNWGHACIRTPGSREPFFGGVSTPMLMTMLPSDFKVKQLAGGLHTLILREDGVLFGCGKNTRSELGVRADVTQWWPTKLLEEVASIGAGDEHSVMKWGRYAYAQGRSEEGQIGNNKTFASGTTTSPTIDDAVVVGAGKYHSLVVRSDGTVWGYGLNDAGQSSPGGASLQPVPRRVEGLKLF